VEIGGAVGAQLSVIAGGEQLDFVHGLANAELDTAMTVDTLIQIGSATKVWTAALIMTLVDEGRLDLDTPVKRYLPELELSDPGAAERITLRHLLSMSAGIDNGDYADYGVGEDAIAKRVAALKTLPQHFAPGAAYGYSNAGTDIAGRVAERVTGQLWDHLLQERIVRPLGLEHTVSLDRERMYHRVAVGYVRDPKSGTVTLVRPWCASRGSGPAGSTLTASAHDLVRFARMFLDGGVSPSGQRVLSEGAVRTMMTRQIDTPAQFFATAWGVGPAYEAWQDIEVWSHAGGNLSGVSYVFWLPERQGAVALVSNTPSAMPRMIKVLTEELMPAAFGVGRPALRAPDAPVAIEPERYVGAYDCIGARLEVVFEDGGLTAAMSSRNPFDDTETALSKVRLVPLGGDHFLMDAGEEADPLAQPMDTAFFGDDGQGRATNTLRHVFAMSRPSARPFAAREKEA
jgi:CubicO group peptidase (beta-lactamase class C family)